MIFGIYDPPTAGGAIKSWPELRVGTVANATEIEYDKQFCGVGTFELYVPIGSRDADKLGLGKFLFSSDGYFIIKQMIYGADNIIVSGTDLNGMLLDRLTVAKTEDGKDKISGSTEYIVKHFVEVNCTSAADTGRDFPGLTIAANRNRGVANDAASPRLEIVADVISDILSAQQMGWRINAVNLTETSTSTLFEFEVYEAVKRTAGTARPKTFSYGFGNADAIKTENSIADAKNTLYCELADGTVQIYSPVSNNAGFSRAEEYADLGCELGELYIYAKHEIAGRYAEVQNVTLEHVDATSFGDLTSLDGFDLGDVVTVVDNNANVTREALISSVKIKRTGENALELGTGERAGVLDTSGGKNAHSLSVTVGQTRVKPLDRVAKAAETVASTVRNIKGTLTVVNPNAKEDRLTSSSRFYLFTPVNVSYTDRYYDGNTLLGMYHVDAMNGYGARLSYFMSGDEEISRIVSSNIAFAAQDINGTAYKLSLGTPETEFYDYRHGTGFKFHYHTATAYEADTDRLEIGFGKDNGTVTLRKRNSANGQSVLNITGINAVYIGNALVWSKDMAAYAAQPQSVAAKPAEAEKGDWYPAEDGIHFSYNGHTKVIPWDD